MPKHTVFISYDYDHDRHYKNRACWARLAARLRGMSLKVAAASSWAHVVRQVRIS